MKQNLILSFDEPVNQVILKSTVKNIQIASDLPWHTFIYCRKYSSIVIQTPENKILQVFPYLGQFLLFGSNREQKKIIHASPDLIQILGKITSKLHVRCHIHGLQHAKTKQQQQQNGIKPMTFCTRVSD